MLIKMFVFLILLFVVPASLRAQNDKAARKDLEQLIEKANSLIKEKQTELDSIFEYINSVSNEIDILKNIRFKIL